MDTEKPLKRAAKKLKTDWQSLSINNITASKVGFGILLQGEEKNVHGEMLKHTAVVTPALSPGVTLNIIMDLYLPKVENLERGLVPLSYYMQEVAEKLSPLTMLVDIRSQQVVIRQAQVVGASYPISGLPFLQALNYFAPKIHKAVQDISFKPPSPADARAMASTMAETYYGALKS